ncbi:hypothetical protein C4K08_4763 [Pseudomonas chlororaphis subsp. aureofaciens]|nr:hypothetical protein C4K08_4763 [Pseudomonas chlororaphis subsp. aureofaciens]
MKPAATAGHAQGRHLCCTRTTIMATGHQCILHQPAKAPVCSRRALGPWPRHLTCNNIHDGYRPILAFPYR